MAIFSDTSYPFGFPSRIKRPHLEIFKYIVTTLRNQDKTFPFLRFDEDGALSRFSESMKTCHNKNIMVQTIGVYAYYFNGKI